MIFFSATVLFVGSFFEDNSLLAVSAVLYLTIVGSNLVVASDGETLSAQSEPTASCLHTFVLFPKIT